MSPKLRNDLQKLKGYHSPQIDVEVRLNTNESPTGPPEALLERAAETIKATAWNRYPDRSALALRTAIGQRYGLGYEHVFCANGSNEVLQTLLLAYAGAGRKTLTFEPSYALHRHLSLVVGAVNIEAERDSDLMIDPSEAAAAISAERPSIAFICSPNNPTGTLTPPEVIGEFLRVAQQTETLVVVDEAYGEFAPRSCVSMLAEDQPLVVVKTFSKTWGLAGARLGYMLGPSWLVASLESVVLPYHLDSFKQALGLAALDYDGDVSHRVDTIVAERERISSRLASLGCHMWPSSANFVLFRPPTDANGLWQSLIERSVLIRNTAGWDRLDGCLRVTVGTSSENDRFLAALGDSLAGSARL